jgi:hypothetical protein
MLVNLPHLTRLFSTRMVEVEPSVNQPVKMEQRNISQHSKVEQQNIDQHSKVEQQNSNQHSKAEQQSHAYPWIQN